jgi:cell division protein ZapA
VREFPCVPVDDSLGTMERDPVELRVGGHSYRVVSSADRETLEHLAGSVELRLTQIVGANRPVSVQSLLLVAIALARDLEEEQERAKQAESRAREMLQNVLTRIDAALDSMDENGEPLPAAPRVARGAAADR